MGLYSGLVVAFPFTLSYFAEIIIYAKRNMAAKLLKTVSEAVCGMQDSLYLSFRAVKYDPVK